nr:PTS sugar transporter subunit IIA [Chloroflexota bacterium]
MSNSGVVDNTKSVTCNEVYLDEKLVCLNVRAADSDTVIRKLAEMLYACGAVKDSYGGAVCKREQQFPTGLPTRGVYVAIPHAEAEHVNYTAIAVATCSPAVPFGNMADPEEKLPVELVIMVAVADSSQQVKMLQRLAEAFGEPETLLALKEARTPAKVVSLLRDKILANGDGEPE